jgi:uncharacterized protein YdaU (DUF1376 family)
MTEKVDVYMAFFVGDYLADTMALSTTEHGAYLLLLFALWRNKGHIDATPARLASTTKVDPESWPGVWMALKQFFDVKDGKLSQRRLLAEIENATARKVAARKNGRRGGLTRARLARNSLELRLDSASSKSQANVKQTPSEPQADLKQTSSERSSKPSSKTEANSSSSSPSPSSEIQISVCDPPTGARDPGAPVQVRRDGAGAVTGPLLTQMFGRIRSELWADVLPWSGTPSSPEKAGNMAGSIPPEDVPIVEQTMRMLLGRAKAGEHPKGLDIVKSPGYGFACWCQTYHELREELLGKAPAKVANGGAKRRDMRTGYAEPPPAGTVYPSGTVDLREGGGIR